MTSDELSVRFEAVTKRYGATLGLDDVSFDVRVGEIVALLGPNGAGKSTAMSILLGLRQADSGRVSVLGSRPAVATAAGRVGALLQSSPLPAWATVSEVVDLERSLHGQGRPASDLLALAGIESIASRRVEGLSGGQAQRVRFALAMAGDPDVLFLDEPTAAMDLEGRRSFWSTMRSIAAARKAVLFATHHLDEAEAAADRVIVLSHGRVVASGPPSSLRDARSVRTVRFELPSSDLSSVADLPGVVEIQSDGRVVTLRSTEADVTVRALCHAGVPFRSLDIAAASLEDAFLALVQEEAAR